MKHIILVFSLLLSITAYSQKSVRILPNSDSISLSFISKEQAAELFAEMKTSPLFNMADCNNCEDRANAIAYILSKKGLNAAKFWLFGEGKVSVSNQVFLLKSSKCGTWGYHVAVGLATENNGIRDTLILDPATQITAVTLRDWAIPLIQPARTGYLIVKNRDFYTYPVWNNKFKADQEWTAFDATLWKTSCGLCGFKPGKCDKKRFKERINNKKNELTSN